MANINRTHLQELTSNATITKEVVDLQIQCAICFVEFLLNESEVRKLQCTHLFHAECLLPWLQRNTSCPVCRAPLSNADRNRVTLETTSSDAMSRAARIIRNGLDERNDVIVEFLQQMFGFLGQPLEQHLRQRNIANPNV